MKWKVNEVTKYIRNPDPAVKVFFIHGNNEGYVNEVEKSLATAIADVKDPFTVDNFDSKDREFDEERFFMALNTMSLMMNRRLIRINGIRTGMDKWIKRVLKEYTGDTLVLIKSDYVNKDNEMFKLFNNKNEPALVMVTCFEPDAGYMHNMIAEEVKKAGKTIDNDVINWIIRTNSKDYLVAKSELEKLITYAWDKNKITIDDVKAVANENAEVNIQKTINAVLNGDLPKIGPMLFELFSEENSPSTVVTLITRQMSEYVAGIKEAKQLLASGEDTEKVLKGVFHVPFMAHPQAQITRRFIDLWSYEKLDMVGKEMLELEKLSRGQSMPVEIITERSMYKIACLKTNS